MTQNDNLISYLSKVSSIYKERKIQLLGCACDICSRPIYKTSCGITTMRSKAFCLCLEFATYGVLKVKVVTSKKAKEIVAVTSPQNLGIPIGFFNKQS